MGLSRWRFTKEFKLAAIRRLEMGASLAEVARAFQVNPNPSADGLAAGVPPGAGQRVSEAGEAAREGHVTEHQRFMLRLLWKELTKQEELIAELETQIEEHARPIADEIARLDQVPDVGRRVAEVVLAEVGAQMQPFPSPQHLASWAGMCPGNEEGAGKRRRRLITPGNRWLKRTLVQAAWVASHTKHTYLASQYRRLAGRRGRKRELIAIWVTRC